MTSDITIKVKVTYKDGGWTALSNAYNINGLGDSPEEALQDYAEQIRKLYSGDKFTTNGRPFCVSYMMTSVAADVYLRAVQETPLTDFGVDLGDEEESNRIPQIEGETIPLLETGINDECLAINIPLSIDTEHKSYGISLGRYQTESIFEDKYIDAVPIGRTGGDSVEIGDWLYIYEKKENGGKAAFVGKFQILQLKSVDKLDLVTPHWRDRHGLEDWYISKRFANTYTSVQVAIINRTTLEEFEKEVPVPDGEKVPRGINWLPAEYLNKIEAARGEAL